MNSTNKTPTPRERVAAASHQNPNYQNTVALAFAYSLADELASANADCNKLDDESVEWKEATGLEVGGDPGGVTPKHLREFIQEQDAKLTSAQQESLRLREAIQGARNSLATIRSGKYAIDGYMRDMADASRALDDALSLTPPAESWVPWEAVREYIEAQIHLDDTSTGTEDYYHAEVRMEKADYKLQTYAPRKEGGK